MTLPLSENKVWHNGRFVTQAEVRIPPNVSALHYAGSVFEGIRSYAAGILFLPEHMERLLTSAQAYHIPIPSEATVPALCSAARAILKHNQMDAGYIRPLMFLGVNPETGSGLKVRPLGLDTEVMVLNERWGKYVSTDDSGTASVLVTNWRRPASDMFPGQAKCSATYVIGQIVSREAAKYQCSEGLFIGLNERGQRCVLDGSGQNLAIVKNGRLTTPDSHRWNILGGLTLDFFLYKLAKEDRVPWAFGDITESDLLAADEVLLFGTASEIVPVGTVMLMAQPDQPHTIGNGRPGPIYTKLRGVFSKLTEGGHDIYRQYLTPHQVIATCT